MSELQISEKSVERIDNEVFKVNCHKIECECGEIVTIKSFVEYLEGESLYNIPDRIMEGKENGERPPYIRLGICDCGRVYLRKVNFLTDYNYEQDS